jgi:uncharacterized UBP type Zn finger protein
LITNTVKHVHAGDRIYAAMQSGEVDPSVCSHLGQINNVDASSSGCEDCLKIGAEWVNLRICLTCGHVGCCDDSPNQHASKHNLATGHPIIQSFNPGETWVYCYPDDALIIS